MNEIKIKFLSMVELDVVTGLAKNGGPIYSQDRFEKGEVFEVNLLDDHHKTIDIQFGDGDCLYGLDKNLIEIV